MYRVALPIALLICAVSACQERPKAEGHTTTRSAATTQPPSRSSTAKQELTPPRQLAELPVTAYGATLAADDEAVYLLTPNAAYRMTPDGPVAERALELGVGPTLTPTAFVFWARGAIWRAPKDGGDVTELAKLPRQPQYFVSSGEALAWVTLDDQGNYSIQTLTGRRVRTLVEERGEIAALTLVGDRVHFVQRPTEPSWRHGSVQLTDGKVAYGPTKNGSRPSMTVGADALYYYDVDQNAIRRRGFQSFEEATVLEKFVCSPLHVSRQVYCGCVEGVFSVSKDTRTPKVLATGEAGTIAAIISNAKWVVWATDAGQNRTRVLWLPAEGS